MNKKYLIILSIIVFVILATGIFYILKPSEPNSLQIGKCGDGVCDEVELKNLNLCPEDCLANNSTSIFDLKYSSIDSDAVKLDLYFPEKTCTGKLPLVIMIHGGAFKQGDKKPMATSFLTDNCYAVASLNYRLSGEAIFPAGNQDVKAAVRWLRANAEKYNLDSDNFGAMGGSAGGYYSSFLGTTGDIKDFDIGDNLEYSSVVQAVVDQFGPVDFSTLAQDRIDAKSPTNPAETDFLGCDVNSADCTNIITASPINYVSEQDPPFFILHGAKDNTIPIKQSQDFYKKLQEMKVPVTFITLPNAGHGGAEFRDYLPQIIKFFDKYLKESEDNISTQDNGSVNNNQVSLDSAFIAVHMEVGGTPKDLDYQEGNWPVLIELVELANKYDHKLTLQFNPQWASYILEEQSRLSLLRAWELDGHEIALHHHGPSHGDWNGYTNVDEKKDDPRYIGTISEMMTLMKQLPASGLILNGGITNEDTDWPEGIIYDTNGGRSKNDLLSKPETVNFSGYDVMQLTYRVATKNGADLTEIEKGYNSAKPGEIMGLVFHAYNYDRNSENHLGIQNLFASLAEHNIQVKSVSDIFNSK